MKIAFICTGNTARSQIAEALAKHYVKILNKNIEIFSAGSNPAGYINPFAIKVLEEKNLDISNQYSKPLEEIPLNEIDLFITLCDNARESCPYIPNSKYIHFPLEDPACVKGDYKTKLEAFRKTRDLLDKYIKELLIKL